jgi:hypothetical protein
MQGVQDGEFRISLVRGQHRAKNIGRREHNFGKVGAVKAGYLRGKHVLQFVSKFAKFVKAAGCGISFERVDHAANAAKHLLVGGTRLEFETCLVESLQEFRGALKEQRAQLARAVLGLSAHVVASMR